MTKEELIQLFDKNNENISKYQKNKKRIKEINKNIEKIKKQNDTNITTTYNKISNGKTNIISSKIENCIERKEEKIKDLEEEKEQLEAENKELKSKMEDVQIALKSLKFKERTIIREHYIEGNSYEDIGNRIFWNIFGQTRSGNAIQKISDKAVEKILKIM